MNKSALTIPAGRLFAERESRVKRKIEEQLALDKKFGARRVKITGYMENLGWPELFGYDMNKFIDDPAFCIEQTLRRHIFWLDNVNDDTLPVDEIECYVGNYFDLTLFGMKIEHTENGTPNYQPHVFQDKFEPSTLGNFDFYKTGDMPKLIAKYNKMKEIAKERYGESLKIYFPRFRRGALDTYVQLRGYENFVGDMAERPKEFMEVMFKLADDRIRFAHERAKFIGEKGMPVVDVRDDWVNIPFITPAMFNEFVVPVYERIMKKEGPATFFHSCGNIEDVVKDLMKVLNSLKILDVSAWNDVRVLDERVDRSVTFNANIKNILSLGDIAKDQQEKLDALRQVKDNRQLVVCAQAIVKIYPTYEENMERLNRFIDRARKTLVES